MNNILFLRLLMIIIIIINGRRFCDYLIRSLNSTVLYTLYKLPRVRTKHIAVGVGKFDNFYSRSTWLSLISLCSKFISNNNNKRSACSFPTPFPGRISEMLDAPWTGLPVSSYTRHCPACMPSKILYLVERESNVPSEKPSSQIIFVRVTSPSAVGERAVRRAKRI